MVCMNHQTLTLCKFSVKAQFNADTKAYQVTEFAPRFAWKSVNTQSLAFLAAMTLVYALTHIHHLIHARQQKADILNMLCIHVISKQNML